jgi:hypothetical protein
MDIINESIKEYYKILNKKFLIKEELLENRYILKNKGKCEICNKEVINDEKYCKIHYEENMKNEEKNKNDNIDNNELFHIKDNIYKDYFGIEFILEGETLILKS